MKQKGSYARRNIDMIPPAPGCGSYCNNQLYPYYTYAVQSVIEGSH